MVAVNNLLIIRSRKHVRFMESATKKFSTTALVLLIYWNGTEAFSVNIRWWFWVNCSAQSVAKCHPINILAFLETWNAVPLASKHKIQSFSCYMKTFRVSGYCDSIPRKNNNLVVSWFLFVYLPQPLREKLFACNKSSYAGDFCIFAKHQSRDGSSANHVVGQRANGRVLRPRWEASRISSIRDLKLCQSIEASDLQLVLWKCKTETLYCH